MRLHFLGVCGTFMGSLAIIARELGHEVSGSDQHVYPPMSTQLGNVGIPIIEGYDPSQLDDQPDLVIIGNAMSRGNPCVEAVLDRGIAYTSGPQWLHDHLLKDRWVLAVSGTHGKTTTATMLAWILEYAGMSPGFLIGGVPLNFDQSARLGDTDFFVIEADEYDTAFFDKRSKFVHYTPRTLVINNLEFDHADIFENLAAIQKQFHHLMRILPSIGQVIYPGDCESVKEVISMGCWSDSLPTTQLPNDRVVEKGGWVESLNESGQWFAMGAPDSQKVEVEWALTGAHNQRNALHAALAARHVGVTFETSAQALNLFRNVKRRMEYLGTYGAVSLYDDFAHHPTAIETTLNGMRAKIGNERLIAIVEPRSNTMKQGVFERTLAKSAIAADSVYWYQPSDQSWSIDMSDVSSTHQRVFACIDDLIADVVSSLSTSGSIPSHVVMMSNGSFENIHDRMAAALQGND